MTHRQVCAVSEKAPYQEFVSAAEAGFSAVHLSPHPHLSGLSAAIESVEPSERTISKQFNTVNCHNKVTTVQLACIACTDALEGIV